jgi:hypothetical protein
LINNRQAGRRNRGRNNNGRTNNGSNRGGGDNGNRIDNRARGNAAQLLEKYRNMARDAQMIGDRVNAEYYLQFADHYFRVLADNRARQEEQQQRYRRNDDDYGDDGGDDFDTADYGADDGRGDQPERATRDQDRRPDDQREARGNHRRDRNRRDRADEDGPVRQEMGAEGPAGTPAELMAEPAARAEPAPEAEAPRPRRGRPRKSDTAKAAEPADGLDATILPPSIARADNDAQDEPDEEAAPKKRARRPRSKATEAAE